MITRPNAMPLARNVVQRVDQSYLSSLCTAPVLDAAGTLLDAWCVTADEHGVDMGGAYPGGEWAERLAVVALEMVTRQVREPRPSTPEEAIALLDVVAARLAERGITTSRDVRACLPDQQIRVHVAPFAGIPAGPRVGDAGVLRFGRQGAGRGRGTRPGTGTFGRRSPPWGCGPGRRRR